MFVIFLLKNVSLNLNLSAFMTMIQNRGSDYSFESNLLKGDFQKKISDLYEDNKETDFGFFTWIYTRSTSPLQKGDKLVQLFEHIIQSDAFIKEPKFRESAEIIQSFLLKKTLTDESRTLAEKCIKEFQEKREKLYPELKEAKNSMPPSLFAFPRELLLKIAEQLGLADLSRFSRSCKQGEADRKKLLEDPTKAVSKAMVQKAVELHDFDRLIALFKSPNKETSDYPLELELQGELLFESVKKIFSFFTNIKKLHFVNAFFKNVAEKNVTEQKSHSVQMIEEMATSCKQIEDFAIKSDQLWQHTILATQDLRRQNSMEHLFLIQLENEHNQRLAIAKLALQSMSLKQLNLTGCCKYFIDEILQGLDANSLLETLHTSRCIDIKAINHVLINCSKLKELDIAPPPEKTQNTISANDIFQLEPSTILSSFSFPRRNVTDDGVAHIRKIFPNLKNLNLEGCSPTVSEGFRSL